MAMVQWIKIIIAILELIAEGADKQTAAKLILQIIHKMRNIRLVTHQNLCRL